MSTLEIIVTIVFSFVLGILFCVKYENWLDSKEEERENLVREIKWAVVDEVKKLIKP